MTPALRLASSIAVLGSLVLLFGCSEPASEGSGPSLSEIRESGELVVLTRNAPTTRYMGRHGQATGPEQDLVSAFARYLGVDVRFKELPTVSAVLAALKAGEGDLAAAGLTATPQRRERFRFGPGYQYITQQVVCRRDNVQPEGPADLVGLDLKVIADSSYAERLRTLRDEQLSALTWSTTHSKNTEELLRQVWQREIDCTVADSNLVAVNRRYLPELTAPLNLSREQELAWALPRDASGLERAVSEWLAEYRASGRLANIHEEYYSFFREFDYVDIRSLIRRIDQRFPLYRQYFRRAAEKYDLPYTLIAAQGYQESHWLANARSPTGVRGIMMLTLPTAKELGVTNRLDPRQSIMGGARYLSRLKKRFDPAVPEPDRTRLALAAYNVGRGHLHDAQVLARRQDLDPHDWQDIKQVLPLLAKRSYYRNLKYGYARGWEPVRYVRRIREYRHVLEREL